MDVRSFFLSYDNYIDRTVELSGWLVLIDGQLFIIEREYGDDYKTSQKVKLADRYIACVLADNIPPIGGGESFIFHEATIIGKITNDDELKIYPTQLFVEGWENGKHVEIDLSPTTIEKAKEKHFDIFNSKKTGDWLDDW